MMRLCGFFMLALTIALVASSCGGADSLHVRINEEFALSMGQRAFISDENLEIRFKEVLEESRCPRGVTCFWAGRVSCMVEIIHTGSPSHMVLTEPGLTDEYTEERYEGYGISFHVTPYPEADKEITEGTYRLHLIISKLPELTKTIGSIIAEPFAFEGQEITIVGYYRGWDLFHEANAAPPVTRSDWVITDATGAIYISANSEGKVPKRLRPSSLEDMDSILEVKGIVRVTQQGQPYVEARSIKHLKAISLINWLSPL